MGAIIGIIMGLMGILDARSRVVFTDADALRQMYLNLITMLAVSVAAMVFGLIASGKKSGRIMLIIFGLMVVACGVVVIWLKSYFAGGLFLVGGLVSSLGALFPKDFA